MSDTGQKMERATAPARGSSLWEPARQAIRKYLGPRQDTSWHDSMVKRANESFLPKKAPVKSQTRARKRSSSR